MSRLTQEELFDRCPYRDPEHARLWIEGYEAAQDEMAINRKLRRRQEFSTLDIIDYCIDRFYNKNAGGGVALADAFREIHNQYKVPYEEIHRVFWKQYDAKMNEVGLYVHRTSDIFVKGWERRAMPQYKGQWVSHMYLR